MRNTTHRCQYCHEIVGETKAFVRADLPEAAAELCQDATAEEVEGA